MRIALFAATALAACSAQPTAPTPTPTPGASATSASARTEPAQPSTTPPPAQVAVAPGELKTFGDWTVGCDNTALCTMASLGPDMGDFPSVTMQLLRQPGPEGAIDLAFDTLADGPPLSPVAVQIDGRRMPLPALNGPAAEQVAKAMANGRTLTVLGSGNRPIQRVSLAGASAALRWIDAQQGRAGTVTALVARGDRIAATVPDRRAAPVIAAAVPTGVAAQPTARQLAAMNRQAECEMPPGADASPELAVLGDGKTLVILPCSAGAYNVIGALFVLTGDHVVPARADAPAGFAETGADPRTPVTSVVNGAWKNGELTSYAKGRGLGDCGVHQTFVWDGARLRLSEQSEMRECRGNPNFIPTWRAQVVRR